MALLRLKLALFEALERAIRRHSLLGDHRFFSSEQFRWVSHVEQHFELIRAELDRVLEFPQAIPAFQEISREQAMITNDDRWKTFFFYVYGRKMQQNCDICPQTAALLRTIPGMRTAFFSILLPEKVIPVHRGPYCGVLRYHLGLRIPTPEKSCAIEVGGHRAHWSEGGSLIFDDSYLHTAWNFSSHMRVILFVDFLRPLPFPMSLINSLWVRSFAFSPFVRNALKRQRAWDQMFQDAYRD